MFSLLVNATLKIEGYQLQSKPTEQDRDIVAMEH